MATKKLCALIPAAGKGSRLGMNMPKLLVDITENMKVMDILVNRLNGLVDEIIFVVSPDALKDIKSYADANMKKYSLKIDFAVQEKPIGMGDAIFCCYEKWKDFDNIVIIWGDQVGLSKETVKKVIQSQTRESKNDAGKNASAGKFTLPLIVRKEPYVEYIIEHEENAKLTNVLQKREGDKTHPEGYNDVGVFALSTREIKTQWKKYLESRIVGKETKEINFLPFLPFLSKQGWSLEVVKVEDFVETMGVNTPDELQFFKKHFNSNIF